MGGGVLAPSGPRPLSSRLLGPRPLDPRPLGSRLLGPFETSKNKF